MKFQLNWLFQLRRLQIEYLLTIWKFFWLSVTEMQTRPDDMKKRPRSLKETTAVTYLFCRGKISKLPR